MRPKQINGKRVASPEYRAWQALKNRCLNPRATDFKYYGGRGITVCVRWMLFDSFIEDIGRRPSKLHTLERRDCNGHYTPLNCCWATRRTQSRNRRFIKRYQGLPSWEIAKALGLKPAGWNYRLWRFRKGLMTEQQLYAHV